MELEGKKILIVGGAYQHCKLVETAHRLGLIVYVIDYLPVDKSPAKRMADYHFEYNITDYDDIVLMCLREHIDGVLSSHLDACQIPYRVICDRLGLPCFGNENQFFTLTNKKAFLQCCSRNGIDIIPQYEESDFINHSSMIEYPVLVKPCDSRGSRGQTVCYSFSEISSALAFAKNESQTGTVIIEKYMIGKPDFSMSYLVIDGESYLVRTCDRYLGSQNDHMDRSAILEMSPSKYHGLFLEKANDRVKRMIKQIGIRNGPVFMQGFIDDGVFRFYDPGLRFPGSEYERMFEHIYGVDICEALVIYAITGRIPPHFKELERLNNLDSKLSSMLFIPIRPGRLAHITGLDTIKQQKNVVSVFQKYCEGDIIGEHYNVNQRFCEVDIVCDSLRKTKDIIAWIYETLKLEDQEKKDMKMSMLDTKRLAR